MENVSTVTSPRDGNGATASTFAGSPVEAAIQKTGQWSLQTLLDEVHAVLSSPNCSRPQTAKAVDQLFHGLRGLRLSTPEDKWKEMVRAGREHPLRQFVHQDPFTSRAYDKPRGYAGDAVMMDYIYGREEGWTPPAATDLGQAVFDYTTGAPASAGVRERRCYIAELLDRIGRSVPNAQILSVAAGHLREASLSVAVRRQQFQRFVALDTDQESVEEINRQYGRYGIQSVVANARQMLTGKLDLGTFDLIYSTGLYDYLADETGKQLTANLFRALHSGGKLVIANFLPGIRDVGYMEMYMGWHLIYRDRAQMMVLAESIPVSQIEEIRIIAERNENVVIMEMTKR
jgi:SAM-dependent methyltransferase